MVTPSVDRSGYVEDVVRTTKRLLRPTEVKFAEARTEVIEEKLLQLRKELIRDDKQTGPKSFSPEQKARIQASYSALRATYLDIKKQDKLSIGTILLALLQAVSLGWYESSYQKISFYDPCNSIEDITQEDYEQWKSELQKLSKDDPATFTYQMKMLKYELLHPTDDKK